MARNQVTIKDVAREAGVSTATVSYVINNRTDIKISDETRKKVLQVINLLDYSPNQAAKALAANRKSLLAIYLSPSDSVLEHAESMYALKVLTNYFHQNKYEVILLNDRDFEKCDQADAIICYNTSSANFRKLGDNNFIPLLALDCMINDPLFFQVNTDPLRLKDAAQAHFNGASYTHVMMTSPNDEKKVFYLNYFEDTEFISAWNELDNYIGRNLLVSNHTLYELLRENNDVCYVPSLTDEKLAGLSECIESALTRTPIAQHNVLL